jgi:hypothetical protein
MKASKFMLVQKSGGVSSEEIDWTVEKESSNTT